MALSLLNALEILGALTGYGYLIYVIRGKRISWIFYFLSCLFYVPVMYHQDMPLYAVTQVFFALTALYGYWTWGRDSAEFKVRKLGSKSYPVFGGCILLTLIFWRLFGQWPTLAGFYDAYLTAASLVATLLTAQRHLASWVYWVSVNILGVLVYTGMAMYPTVVLFILNLIFSIFGLRSWRRLLASNSI